MEGFPQKAAVTLDRPLGSAEVGPVKPQATPPVFPGKEIEVHGLKRLPPNRIRHALFDFDGTLSLLRGGWQEVMTAQFVTVLGSAETAETPQQIERTCREFITRLTGKQTIYQMLRLEEEMRNGVRPALPPQSTNDSTWPC